MRLARFNPFALACSSFAADVAKEPQGFGALSKLNTRFAAAIAEAAAPAVEEVTESAGLLPNNVVLLALLCAKFSIGWSVRVKILDAAIGSSHTEINVGRAYLEFFRLRFLRNFSINVFSSPISS